MKMESTTKTETKSGMRGRREGEARDEEAIHKFSVRETNAEIISNSTSS